MNAVVLGTVVPWYPGIKSDLALSNTALGLAIAMGPAAALTIGATAGPLIARLGSGRAATLTALLQLTALPIIGLATSWPVLALGIVVLGGTDTITDAAMNAHGMRVQRRYGRSIINAFHAMWSAGAVVGGTFGAAMVGLGVDRGVQLSVTAVVLGLVVAAASRWLLPGPEHAERPEEVEVGRGTAERPDRRPSVRQAIRVAPLVLLGFGLMLVAAVMVEDVAASWAAIHLRETLAASAFVAGLGFVLAQSGMVVGRTLGDRAVDRLGPTRVARAGYLLGAAGVGLAAFAPGPTLALAGFGIAGLGVSTLYPLVMAAASDIPGVRSGDGIAITSWMSRAGFLVGPPLVGVVADAAGLPLALSLVAVVALAGSTLTSLLTPRSATAPTGPPPAANAGRKGAGGRAGAGD